MIEEKKGDFHSIEIKEVIKTLNSSEKGLSSSEVKFRNEKYGYNVLTEKRTYPYLIAFLKQFKSFFVYILLIAAGISFYLNHLIDAYVILGIIFINITIGFAQEQKAERAMKALKKLVVSYSKVYRNGELIRINSREIVVGDIIVLEEGDKIPADSRLIKIKNFRTVEASLTGESLPILKNLKIYPESTQLADQKNMIFSGTFVAGGTAKAIVVNTGNNTEIGRIAKSIGKIKRAKNHFQLKTHRLAIQMGLFAITGAIITFLIGYFHRNFEFSEIFLFTISSLVSAIPEGLPAVLSIVLAIGALRMSRKKAIIRNLPSTETLGVVDTIMTDKTGTLTENTMTVKKIYLSNGEKFNVGGVGWEPIGEFKKSKEVVVPLENKTLSKLLHISSLSTNARVIKEELKKNKKSEKTYEYKCLGDPTEAALVVLAEKSGLKKEVLESQYKKLDELPFDPKLKYRANLSSLIKLNSKKEIYVVGSPEEVLEKCKYILIEDTKKPLGPLEKSKAINSLNSMASEALRVIAISYKEATNNKEDVNEKDINDLTFVGLVGMIDPPREEVKSAIEKTKSAGIRVIMATGDHKNTALAIAKNIGLIKNNNENQGLSQNEIEKLSYNDFKKAIKKINVFARLTPDMKLKIADELQKEGHIIAMTGDGVNDAPALKKADIGISMGINGTDVARESSEMVLANDNFSTIVDAIEEGRIVFSNTKRTSFFLVTTNVAEQITIISTLTIGLPLPLLPTQILWLNLVTDTGAGIGLATEPGHHDILNRKPRNAKENILTKEAIPFVLLMSIIMVLLTIFIFTKYLTVSLDKARTGAFLVMAFTQIFNSFNLRSIKFSILKLGIFKNKVLIITTIISILLILGIIYIELFRNLFSFSYISSTEFIYIILISSSVLIIGEFYKLIARKYFYKINTNKKLSKLKSK